MIFYTSYNFRVFYFSKFCQIIIIIIIIIIFINCNWVVTRWQ